ncbi:MAG: tetratricopeptide repeat protein [Bdellovibrionales bacterium]
MDDWGYITQNPLVRDTHSPWHFWTTLHQTDYWPLTYTLYWLFYKMFGENPSPYHAINFVLHAFNATLVFAIAQQRGVRWSLVAALLFLVHPLHVQAVAWMVQLKTLLSTALALICLWSYSRCLATAHRSWWAIGLASFVLAILAKTSVVFLPVVLLALHGEQWWTSRDGRKPIWNRWLATTTAFLTPFFMVSLVGGWITMRVNAINFIDRSAYVFQMPGYERPFLMAQNLLFYLKSFLVPYPLAYLYPLRVPRIDEAASWFILAGALLLVFTLFRTLPERRGRVHFASYLVLLFPGLGLISIPNMKLSLVADHWAYLPDVFMVLALAPVLNTAAAGAPRVARGCVGVCVTFFAALSFLHARTFTSERTFWLQAEAVNPESAVPAYNLGAVADKARDHAESLRQYDRAVRLDPGHDRAWYNLGRIHLLNGNLGVGRECLEKAIRLNPRLTIAYVGLAKMYASLRQHERALEILRAGLAEMPLNRELRAHWEAMASASGK